MNNIIIEKKIIDDLDTNVYSLKKDEVVVFNLSSSNYNEYTFNLEENAHLIINKMYNEEEINENIIINLNGINSKVDYNFSTKVYNDQKYIININHNNKSTISNIVNHGVVMNDANLTFEVNSTIKKGNSKSKLNQESKIIVMSKNNSVIKPNLYIDEFDVDAVHSATIGRFNKEEIFYLMTKGVTKEEATNLLIKGFLEGHVRR